MIIDALIQVVVFLIEAIVVVIAILVVVAGICAIICKGKVKEKTRIKIRKLNEYYEDLKNALNRKLLSKAVYKKQQKAKQDQLQKKEKGVSKKRLFVIDFDGDIRASEVDSLREEITAILNVAEPQDEVVVKLESAGGLAHSYGLAASQLQRIKEYRIPLTVIVDKVAASGGYMMACVADKILAAPFSIIGSIGVVAQLPNFHRLLDKHHIDFEQVTGGKYKRTLTLFGENTKEARKKFQEEVDEVHDLFKDFVKQHRPQIDIDALSTGEHWSGTKAFELKLVDEIMTSDDYLLQASKVFDLYEIRYHKKKKLLEKLFSTIYSMIHFK